MTARGLVIRWSFAFVCDIHIHITASMRVGIYISTRAACWYIYLHEGVSPRERFVKYSTRGTESRVLYLSSTRIVAVIRFISSRGIFLLCGLLKNNSGDKSFVEIEESKSLLAASFKKVFWALKAVLQKAWDWMWQHMLIKNQNRAKAKSFHGCQLSHVSHSRN